jgi:hypothetical protein
MDLSKTIIDKLELSEEFIRLDIKDKEIINSEANTEKEIVIQREEIVIQREEIVIQKEEIVIQKEEIVIDLPIPEVNKSDIQIKNIPDEKEFVMYLNSLWSCDKENTRILNDLNETTEINIDELNKFKQDIADKFENIKIIGNFNYLANELEKEVQLAKDDLKEDDLKLAFIAEKDLSQHNSINNYTMNKINKVHIGTKIKDETKSKLDSKNYRFIQIHSKVIKLIDRLWCLKVHDIVKSLDTNIFKSNLIKQMNDGIVKIANQNTLSRDNVVLIDIEKAFDSCDYNVVEELLIRSLSKKINEDLAINLAKQYIFIIRQRIIYYKDNKIDFKKGIPTGLPSSNIIFSILMDEIIKEWINEYQDIFKIDKDFIINIFVDDIYLKLINLEFKDIIVKSLVDKFKKYKFNVNFEKCKADEKLKLEFFTNLEEEDMYLGILFTRDIKKYSTLVLNIFNKKNNSNYSYEDIHKNNSIPKGYFNYKLKPLMNEDENVIQFIQKNLI